MDLSNLDLLDLQTSYMQQDPTVKAICNTLGPYFKKLSDDVKLVYIYGRLDELDETLIDELAWQFHVDFYDYTLPLEKKIDLVKNSIRWHQIKGTPQAVTEVATSIFGRTKLKEWFQYEADPYFFMLDIDVTEQGASEENLKKLDILINEYKNTRSWIDVINIFFTTKGDISFGVLSIDAEEITVYPWTPKDVNSKINYTIPISQSASNETITTYPKEAI